MTAPRALYAVVDAGTTTTRVRLWRDGAVVWTASRQAGARDTAIDGAPDKIRGALGDLLGAAREASGREPDAIICSGMITSNMGLHEVPHLSAPATLGELACGIRQVPFPELSATPFSFIPGVKTPVEAPSLRGIGSGDVLRGEEAEVAGLRHGLALEGAATFLHIGSHHKAIWTSPEGTILGSSTAITGELLSATVEHTILRSSTVALVDAELDLEAARVGAADAREHGLTRALFLVRVGEQLARIGKQTMTSYLLGAFAQTDLALLRGPEEDGTVIVYGGGAFPTLLQALLEEEGYLARVVEPDTADHAAVVGAVALYRRYLGLGGPQHGG